MRGTVFTPFFFGPPAVELAGTSQLWRKKVLPVGDVEYKGRVLHFDRDYLAGLVSSFDASAYDQVPFQLADAANAHTNDPERYRGSVVRLELAPDGLYALARVTPEGERLLTANPNLGVSARIVEDYSRSDGQYYPAAIQHVLGTLDPRIPQLGPWQAVTAVEASNSGGSVLDLTNYAFAGDEPSPDYDDDSAAVALRQLAYAHDGHPAGIHLHRAASAVEAGEDPGEHIAAALDAWGDDSGVAAELRSGSSQHAEPAGAEFAAALAADAWAGTDPLALEMATALAGQGDYGALAELAGTADAIELARTVPAGTADALDRGIELANAREQQRQAGDAARRAEDAARPARASTSDRIQAAYARIERGTYVPRDFAAATGLGHTGLPNCGVSDDLGYCASATHEAGCGSLADTALAEVLTEEGVYDAVTEDGLTDASGRSWFDQHGQEMNLTAQIEALTGERLGDGVSFESGYGPRELRQPQRHLTYDPDPDSGAGPVGFAPATMAAMLQVREQMGEPRRESAASRGMERVMARGDLSGPHYRRLQHPDYSGAQTMAERAELGKQEFGLAAVDEVLPGALPQFTRGSI